MIRVDVLWLSAEPMDMRAGTNTALGRVVAVFGAAHPHHAYVFVNRRGDRLKVLVHDGIGVWLCARRLHQGGFVRASLMNEASGLFQAPAVQGSREAKLAAKHKFSLTI